MFAVISLFCLNLAFFIGPHMLVHSNPLIAAAKDAGTRWNGLTVIYFTSRTEVDGVFEYFNDRNEWRRLSPKAIMRLDDDINETYNQGGSVWLNDVAAKSVDSEWLLTRVRGEQIEIKLADRTYRWVQLLPTR